MKRARQGLALIALLLGALPAGLPGAGALIAPTLTLAQQATRAEVIVRVKLGPPTTVREGEVSYRVYPLTVVETLAGDAAQLPQHEGAPALFFLQGLEGLPALKAGDEAVALLYARRLDSPLVGFGQGWYALTDGKVAAGEITDPAKLREALLAAREAK